MRVRSRILVAGTGLAVALGVGVPVALAETSTGTPPTAPAAATSSASSSASSNSSTTPASTCERPVAAYLKAHPDLAAELKKIQGLPQAQRAGERQSWFTAHPDEKTGLQQARKEGAAAHLGRLAPLTDAEAQHPDLAGLVDAVQKAPAGQKAAAATSYLAAHPDLKGVLKSVRTAERQARATCPTGTD